MEKALVCKCGKQGELKEFLTFSYYYCPICKDEVKPEKNHTSGAWLSRNHLDGLFSSALALPGLAPQNAVPPSVTPISSLPICPPGYAAIKDEWVSCSGCGVDLFRLPEDLEGMNGTFGRRWSGNLVDLIDKNSFGKKWENAATCPVCTAPFAYRNGGRVHVEHRGWV